MAETEPTRPPGRRWGRRPGRESVPADPSGLYEELSFDRDDDDDEGSAGVREPRHPKPRPVSGAGALPEPEPPVLISLADPRH
jgi:hypothetical protein